MDAKNTDLKLKVVATHAETPLVRAIELAATDGAPLPGFAPGSHIKVRLPEGGERHYSLVNWSLMPSASREPRAYHLGVRLEEASKGGSRYMHALQPGDIVTASAPANNFHLIPTDKTIVLLAGGIGVTPIISMAAALKSQGHPFRFVYAGRSRGQLAFLQEIEALAGITLQVHADDEAGRFFDVAALMASFADREPLYLCGPTPMIDAARAAAKRLDWAPGRLNFEVFSAPVQQAGDGAFEVVVKGTGQSFQVPVGKTILDVLLEAGLDPLHDCKRGECGVCQVGVVEGTPDHRDFILTDAERESGKTMQICISRSKSARLVLDL